MQVTKWYDSRDDQLGCGIGILNSTQLQICFPPREISFVFMKWPLLQLTVPTDEFLAGITICWLLYQMPWQRHKQNMWNISSCQGEQPTRAKKPGKRDVVPVRWCARNPDQFQRQAAPSEGSRDEVVNFYSRVCFQVFCPQGATRFLPNPGFSWICVLNLHPSFDEYLLLDQLRRK